MVGELLAELVGVTACSQFDQNLEFKSYLAQPCGGNTQSRENDVSFLDVRPQDVGLRPQGEYLPKS
jgi:hypothetical protein